MASKSPEGETYGYGSGSSVPGGGLFVVLDIAHNEAALLALSDKIKKEFPGYEIR
jgi:folylpolyglutamate synthase/dihydropteroate synthase